MKLTIFVDDMLILKSNENDRILLIKIEII